MLLYLSVKLLQQEGTGTGPPLSVPINHPAVELTSLEMHGARWSALKRLGVGGADAQDVRDHLVRVRAARGRGLFRLGGCAIGHACRGSGTCMRLCYSWGWGWAGGAVVDARGPRVH